MQESITSDEAEEGSGGKREILRSRAPCCEEFRKVLRVTQGNLLEIDIQKNAECLKKTLETRTGGMYISTK